MIKCTLGIGVLFLSSLPFNYVSAAPRFLKEPQSSLGSPPCIRNLRNGAQEPKTNVFPAATQDITTKNSKDRPLAILQLSSFLQTFSGSLVVFAPTPALVERIGSQRASSILSTLSSSAALVQIVFSSAVGSALDSTGRKPALLICAIFIAMCNAFVSLNPSLVSLCSAKFVGSIFSGFFALGVQAMITDMMASNPSQLSSVIGLQMAVATFGFLTGMFGAGLLSEFNLSTLYRISSLIGVFNVLLVTFKMRESLPQIKRIPFQAEKTKKLLLHSPISSITLLVNHGNKVRVLSIVLMLLTMPQNMGEFFQIFAKTEFSLSTKQFSNVMVMFGVIGLIGNIIGSELVKTVGLKNFTGFAIICSLLSPIGTLLFGCRGLIIGGAIGFLSAAQTMGIIASLISEGIKLGIPQGELAGQRTSLLALLRIIGPVWYSMLYIQGQKI